MRSQRKAFKIAAEMRRETIRMTKNMSPLVLNDMIGTMLSKSLRKYALTLEFFSHKYGVLSLQNPRIAMIYENMLDTDAWWHLFVSKLIYLCYSPTSPFFNVCSFYLLQLLIFNNFFFFHFFFFFIFLRFFVFNLFIYQCHFLIVPFIPSKILSYLL